MKFGYSPEGNRGFLTACATFVPFGATAYGVIRGNEFFKFLVGNSKNEYVIDLAKKEYNIRLPITDRVLVTTTDAIRFGALITGSIMVYQGDYVWGSALIGIHWATGIGQVAILSKRFQTPK